MSATLTPVERPRPAAASRKVKVAYVVSRFPKLTETFVLYELQAVERQGVDVEIYPLQREKTTVMHPEARPLVERAHFRPWLSVKLLQAHIHFLARKPAVYFATLACILWCNLGSLRYFLGALIFFPKAVEFAAHMRQEGVTHVHAHFASHPALAAFVIHRLTGIAYSFTAHGSDLHRDQHMLREKVAEAAFVVTISDYNREMIARICGSASAGKIRVVHCGVDLRQFAASEYAKPAGRLQIICIGTLHEVKGHTHLIEACRKLSERGIALECHFIGDGPDRAQLQREAQAAGLSDHLRLHGSQPRQQVIQRLRQADVMVAPSVPTRDGRREGIPVVLMEAMACGVPVVASRLSGIPELVEHAVTGLLTPPGDAAAIAAAIERLAQQPHFAQQLARAARRRVEQDFNLDRNAALLAAAFRGEEP